MCAPVPVRGGFSALGDAGVQVAAVCRRWAAAGWAGGRVGLSGQCLVGVLVERLAAGPSISDGEVALSGRMGPPCESGPFCLGWLRPGQPTRTESGCVQGWWVVAAWGWWPLTFPADGRACPRLRPDLGRVCVCGLLFSWVWLPVAAADSGSGSLAAGPSVLGQVSLSSGKAWQELAGPGAAWERAGQSPEPQLQRRAKAHSLRSFRQRAGAAPPASVLSQSRSETSRADLKGISHVVGVSRPKWQLSLVLTVVAWGLGCPLPGLHTIRLAACSQAPAGAAASGAFPASLAPGPAALDGMAQLRV